MIEIGRTEDLCRQMDDLADEDHTHHLTPQEVDTYRNKWWIRSNKISSDTMPIRHRWSWQGTWWTPYSYESHHRDVPSSDLPGKPDKISNLDTSSRHDFLDFTCFSTVGSFTADGGLL